MSGDHIAKRNMPWGNSLGNRPNLVMFMPFSDSSSPRLPPSASAILRLIPFRVAAGPCVWWKHVWGQDDDVVRSYMETQHVMGRLRGEIGRF